MLLKYDITNKISAFAKMPGTKRESRASTIENNALDQGARGAFPDTLMRKHSARTS